MKKTDIPMFFHRLRNSMQKIIKIGFLGNNFNLTKESRIVYAYLGVNDEKINKTVFALNESDTITSHMKDLTDEWFNVQNNDAMEIANLIYNNNIDILFALSDNKIIREILNYHAAPFQIAGGIGLTLKDADNSFIDAILGDKFIFASKGIETLKINSAFCYLPFWGNINAETKVNNGEIIFGAVYRENVKKRLYYETLNKILESVPNSKLKIFSESFFEEKNIITAKKFFISSGIKEDKIEFFSTKKKDSFACLSKIDIFLDSYLNSDVAMIMDSLYMGRPTVTMTKVGASILNAVGLSEFVANNTEDYIKLAVSIAKDNERIFYLHKNLRNLMESSNLMSIEKFSSDLKTVIFKSFDYLITLKNYVPTKKEFISFWNDFVDLDYNKKKFAMLDRILLTKPNDNTRILNYIAMVLSYDSIENIEYALQYLPEDSLGKKFTKLVLFDKKKDWKAAEKIALEIKNITPNDVVDENIISTSTHMLADIYMCIGKCEEAAKNHLESSLKTPVTHMPDKYERYSNYLFTLHYMDITPQDIFEAAKNYNNFFITKLRCPPLLKWGCQSEEGGSLNLPPPARFVEMLIKVNFFSF